MARNDNPKEGIDFEWVKGPGGSKTRKFFSMAERTKRKESGGGPTKSSGSGSTKRSSTAPSPRTTPSKSESTPRPKSRPSGGGSAGGRSSGAGGPSNSRERAEATVSKTLTRPIGMARETVQQRRAYDRLDDEGVLLRSPSNATLTEGQRRRKNRTGSYNKGGVVKANCGASIPPSRGR